MKRSLIAILSIVSISAFANNLVLESGSNGEIKCNKSSLRINTTTRNSVSVSCVLACVVSVVRSPRDSRYYCVDKVRASGTSSQDCSRDYTLDAAIDAAYESGDWMISRKQCDEVIYVNVNQPRN